MEAPGPIFFVFKINILWYPNTDKIKRIYSSAWRVVSWAVVCFRTSVYKNTVLFIPAVAGATLALYLSFSMWMHVLYSLLTYIIILYILWCKAVWYSLRVRLSLSLFRSFQGHAHPFRITARQRRRRSKNRRKDMGRDREQRRESSAADIPFEQFSFRKYTRSFFFVSSPCRLGWMFWFAWIGMYIVRRRRML